MELTQLMQFKEIAETGNMTKSADLLYVSQPALSRAIKNLELELGVSLFDRVNRSLILTESGRIVLKYVNRIADELIEMRNAVEKSERSKYAKKIRFCSSASSALRHYTLLFAMHRPDIELTSEVQYQDRIEKALLNNLVDVAISMESISHPELSCTQVEEDSLMLIVPEEHPLAFKTVLELKDLDNTDILRLIDDHYSYLNEYLTSLLKRKGVKPSFIIQYDEKLYHFLASTSNYTCFTSTFGISNITIGENRTVLKFSDEEANVPQYVVYLKKKYQYLFPFIEWLDSYCERLTVS